VADPPDTGPRQPPTETSLRTRIRQAPGATTALDLVRSLRALSSRPLHQMKSKTYLSSNGPKKLQIGTGHNPLDGWLNTDVVVRESGVINLDAKKRFRFGDKVFDYVFTEHQIEQLTPKEAQSMLRECYRVLRPGGKVRIGTPDLGTLLGLYTSDKTSEQSEYVDWIADNFIPDAGPHRDVAVINHAINGFGHKFIYDFETLKDSLTGAGFVNVDQCKIGESDSVALRGIDSHGIAIGNQRMARFETMVLEATRPANEGDGQ